MWGITVLTALSPVDGKMGMGRRGGQTASSPTPSQAFCSHKDTVAPGSTDLEDVCFLLYSCGGDFLCSCHKPPREISGAMRWLPPFLSGSWYSARLPGEVRVEKTPGNLHSNLLLKLESAVKSENIIQAVIQPGLQNPPRWCPYNLSNSLTPTSSLANRPMKRGWGKLGTEYDLQCCRKCTFIIPGCGVEDGEGFLSRSTALKSLG